MSDRHNRILIVDDSESMRMVIRETIKSAGYEAEEANNGHSALLLAQTQQFDLVITDINMPMMDGFTFIKRLRELPDYRFSPILTLTTEGSDEKKAEGKEAGATGWITKPFSPDKLIAALNKLLAIPQSAKTA